MKTNVSTNSINAYHQIAAVMQEQERWVIAAMKPGVAYTRRELGLLAGIENSAAARVVHGLVDCETLVEVGTKRCPITGRTVGAVSLPLDAA